MRCSAGPWAQCKAVQRRLLLLFLLYAATWCNSLPSHAGKLLTLCLCAAHACRSVVGTAHDINRIPSYSRTYGGHFPLKYQANPVRHGDGVPHQRTAVLWY
jgi:hypothetical protein